MVSKHSSSSGNKTQVLNIRVIWRIEHNLGDFLYSFLFSFSFQIYVLKKNQTKKRQYQPKFHLFSLLVTLIAIWPAGRKNKEIFLTVSSTNNLAFKSPAAFCLACSLS